MSFAFKKASIEVVGPSNIAWVKYWGKKDLQLGINPSISMPLKRCVTRSKVDLFFGNNEKRDINLKFEGKERPDFLPKIEAFLLRTEELYPYIKNISSLTIHSENTFPHSSGIASSASAFSALALAFEEAQAKLDDASPDLERASQAARLGSGSACRSFYEGFTLWGRSAGTGNENFGVKIPEVHVNFEKIYNAICVVSSKEKAVGSSAGHALMQSHPYREQRISQANDNARKLIEHLKTGDVKAAGGILEEEALSLHGLMSTSRPSFVLMRPKTLSIIDSIRSFRDKYTASVFFTLDAGPNPHVIYFEDSKRLVEEELMPELKMLCEEGNIIMDEKGPGAKVVESFFEEAE